MDTDKFEKLNGIELGMFAADLVKRGQIDKSIFDYYKSRASTLDGPHLEIILNLLGKMGTPDALNEVAKYLDHPTNYIRCEAIQTILMAPAIDERVMERVVQVLSNPHFHHEALEHALDHGATEEAKRVAKNFRSTKGRAASN
jgi:hypothetical protein